MSSHRALVSFHLSNGQYIFCPQADNCRGDIALTHDGAHRVRRLVVHGEIPKRALFMEDMISKSKILIVDSHRVVIEGIKTILKQYPEFEVIGETYDGIHAVESATSLEPDMVVLDISMPNLRGIETTIQIRRLEPNIKVIIFTRHSNKEYIIPLFRAGISAYVLKEDPVEDLILALKAVRRGGTYFSTTAPTTLIRHVDKLDQGTQGQDVFERLSGREREVFCLLADGKTVKEVAVRLTISPKTVESHKYNIMEKLQTPNIAAFTKLAIKRNLIQI